MRYFLLLLFSLSLFASESKVCQKCHPIIYKEYQQSSHKNSSKSHNLIYKAMFEQEKEKIESPSCSKCHAPSDEKEAISCIYCHTIENIEEHSQANVTKLSGKKREFYSVDRSKKGTKDIDYATKSSFFGLIKHNSGSPYHKIDYSNEDYYSGNVCMGCHSHNKTNHLQGTFLLDAVISKDDKENCVGCHMPKIQGTKVTINETKTHAYHSIAGIKKRVIDMGKYIDIALHVKKNGFEIELINRANHALFGQLYRQGILHVELLSKAKELEPYIFERVLSSDKKELDKDTLLYAKKTVFYNERLLKNEVVKVTLLVKNISDKGLIDLNLSKEIQGQKILKSQLFKNVYQTN